MITISVKEKNTISEVRILGHALYDSYGKDIVCASVSSIVITTINAILLIDKKAISYDSSKGVVIKVLKEDEVINKLLINMVNMLKELSLNYQKNIKFI